MFTACDDDDDAYKLQLEAPVVSFASATSSSLTFTWLPVDGAFEYAYTLYNANGVYVGGGLTSATSATLTDLDDADDYRLEVVSYPQDAMHSTASEVGSATGRLIRESWRVEGTYTSADLGQSWSATLVAYEDNHYEILAWYGVSGYNLSFKVNANASLNLDVYTNDNKGYYYVPTGLSSVATAAIYPSSGYSSFTGDATEGNLYFYNSLTLGGYDTFSWGKTSNDEGSTDDKEDDSTEDETVAALWSAEGSYYSEDLGDTWSATITAYSDGHYVISAWMGVEDYDFTFTVADNSEVQADASYYVDGSGYIYVPTGRSDYSYGYLYTTSGYSSFSGDATKGKVTFYDYIYTGGSDTFTWGE
jgi:hypothetical protein